MSTGRTGDTAEAAEDDNRAYHHHPHTHSHPHSHVHRHNSEVSTSDGHHHEQHSHHLTEDIHLSRDERILAATSAEENGLSGHKKRIGKKRLIHLNVLGQAINHESNNSSYGHYSDSVANNGLRSVSGHISNGYGAYNTSDSQERDSILTASTSLNTHRSNSINAGESGVSGDATSASDDGPSQTHLSLPITTTSSLNTAAEAMLYHHNGQRHNSVANQMAQVAATATTVAWNQMHSAMTGPNAGVPSGAVVGPGNSGQIYDGNAMFVLDSPPSTLVLANLKKAKRQPQPIPDNCKDDAYWERRKRNNESAKKSREMRRWKEQQTTFRVKILEQENLKLKTEVSMLRRELENFRKILCDERRDTINEADSNDSKLIT